MIKVMIYFFLLVELLLVTYIDLKVKRVPNYFTILNLVVFIAFLLILPEMFKFEFNTIKYSLLILLIGFVLFVAKIMGAGDVKYLFSLFLLIPTSFHQEAFGLLLYSTLLIGSFLFLINLVRNFKRIHHSLKAGEFSGIKTIFETKFSYVPVILFSWIWLGWKNHKMLF